MVLSLLHLCDSLFPVGAFAYSDGLETATANGAVHDRKTLQNWIDVVLDESIGCTEGCAAWQAWQMIQEQRWDALAVLDQELIAIRPSASARRSTRAMGQRLLTTWRALHPDVRLDEIDRFVRTGSIAPALPVAFAAACVSSHIGRRETVEAFAYTRLAATVSAAMRLAPIGQGDAHAVLAAALERVPRVVDAIELSGGQLESFTPMMDIALMSQQYLHSRLFRS